MSEKDYEVLRAETVWHCDLSQGIKGSDKVYSVQLVRHIPTGEYRVESQYGKRGYDLRSAPTTSITKDKFWAERSYNELLQSKVKGKKGDAYNQIIEPAIVPSQFGGAGYSRAITKADELKTAKLVDSLYDFIRGNTEAKEVEAQVLTDGLDEGFSALAGMLDE